MAVGTIPVMTEFMTKGNLNGWHWIAAGFGGRVQRKSRWKEDGRRKGRKAVKK